MGAFEYEMHELSRGPAVVVGTLTSAVAGMRGWEGPQGTGHAIIGINQMRQRRMSQLDQFSQGLQQVSAALVDTGRVVADYEMANERTMAQARNDGITPEVRDLPAGQIGRGEGFADPAATEAALAQIRSRVAALTFSGVGHAEVTSPSLWERMTTVDVDLGGVERAFREADELADMLSAQHVALTPVIRHIAARPVEEMLPPTMWRIIGSVAATLQQISRTLDQGREGVGRAGITSAESSAKIFLLANKIRGIDNDAAARILQSSEAFPVLGEKHGEEKAAGNGRARNLRVEVDESTLPPGVTAEEIREQVKKAYADAEGTFDPDTRVGGLLGWGKRSDTIRVSFADTETGIAGGAWRDANGTSVINLSNDLDWSADGRANAMRTLTHEVVHATQSATDTQTGLPGWLVEGMADHQTLYKSGGVPPAMSPTYRGDGKTWNSGYENTARMLEWIKQTREPNIMNTIVDQGHQRTYTDQLLVDAVGGPVTNMDQVWDTYLQETADGLTPDYTTIQPHNYR